MYQYRYSLRNGSRKDVCPNCGRKTFKPYVDAYGNVLAPHVGRCDREQKCRYHLTPSEFLAAYRPMRFPTPMRHSTRPELAAPPTFFDSRDCLRSIAHYEMNPLACFLHSAFDPLIGSEAVDAVMKSYCLGTASKFGGSAVFWLIDHNGRIRDGKVMGFDRQTGKRIKKPYPQVSNAHTLLADRYSGTFKSCFYGAHLLAQSADTPVWVLESEKAALIAALALKWGGVPIGVPVATGGCAGLTDAGECSHDPYHRMQALRGRRVVLFPDEGKFEEWEMKGKALRGFVKELYISTVMERTLHPHPIECRIEPGDGFDDLLLRYFAAGKDTADLIITSYGYRDTHRLV